jgi:hypothetical protein
MTRPDWLDDGTLDAMLGAYDEVVQRGSGTEMGKVAARSVALLRYPNLMPSEIELGVRVASGEAIPLVEGPLVPARPASVEAALHYALRFERGRAIPKGLRGDGRYMARHLRLQLEGSGYFLMKRPRGPDQLR